VHLAIKQTRIGFAQRDRDIRDDMRQFAASKARAGALQQQLHAQTFWPPDSRGEKFDKPRGSYLTYYSLRPRQALWASSPKLADDYCTPVPISTTGDSVIDVVVTPSSSSFVDNFVCVVTNANVCQSVSGDTATVSVLGARPTTSISGGSQQTLSGNYPLMFITSIG